MHKKFPIIASGLVFLSIASIPAALGAHPTPTKVSHLTPSQHREKPKCRIEIDTVHLSTDVLCASRKRTSYYGIAFSKATIGGQRVGAPPARSLKITTLPCGT